MKFFHLALFSCKDILKEKDLPRRQKYISCLLPFPPVLRGPSFLAHNTMGRLGACLSALQDTLAAAAGRLGPHC